MRPSEKSFNCRSLEKSVKKGERIVAGEPAVNGVPSTEADGDRTTILLRCAESVRVREIGVDITF
jgi:hypothetical protein